MSTTQYLLSELQTESRIGGPGKFVLRQIPLIDLSNFDARRDEITDRLWDAAVNVGFFQIANHSIPPSMIDRMFGLSEKFFSLQKEAKNKYPLRRNEGYESLSQIRPSTGTRDQKESYQITRGQMTGLWPTEEIPEFQEDALEFEKLNWELSQRILSCFATKLGVRESFFQDGHDRNSSDYQCTLRMLHYYAVQANRLDPRAWRAGAHTDFDTLTLLYQRQGQHGLEVCPGKEVGDIAWTPVEPSDYIITCNIGDMLMRWSDDTLKSTLHRVRSPRPGDDLRDRYSVVFFAQANKNTIVQGPKAKYAKITAGDFIQQRLQVNYAQLRIMQEKEQEE